MNYSPGLTGGKVGCHDAPAMGAPRHGRGGGWRKSGIRAAFVALTALAFVVGQQSPARADDPLQEALRKKDELERAVQNSRANTERYKTVASQYQAAVDAAYSRIADLSTQKEAAQSQADALALEIQIRQEQLALVSFQLDETKALAESLKAQAAAQQQQLASREDLYAKHLRTTYRLAMVSPLEMLLSAQSLTELAARSGLGAFTGAKLPLWPLTGPITSGFGARWGGFHNGLDIAAPMYTPIRAAAAGQVVTVGKPYLAYGDTATVVIIAHGYNFSTLYGHLDDRVKVPVVRVGQMVGAGQVIAYVGMTGWTTGPHLHFMTIVNGRAVDPRPYLP